MTRTATSLVSLERWDAIRDETRRLPPGREGISIRVVEGTLVVTQSGDPQDHVLGPGDELRLAGQGLGVAWALEPSVAVIVRGQGHEAGPARPLAA